MATLLDTFITKFRFKSDRNDLKNIEKGVGRLKANILEIGATIAGVFGTGAFLGITAEKLDSLQKFSDSIGISVGQLQELQFASERSGVSINDLRSSLLNMNRVVGQTARGYGIYGQVLARFGVAIRDSNGHIMSTFQIFQELNKVFSRLSRAQQFDLAQNLGLTPNTVKLLQQSPKDFENLIRQADKFGLATRRSTERAAKFNDALTDFKQTFFALSSQVAAAVFPVLTKVLEFFSKLLSHLQKNTILLKLFGIGLTSLATIFAVLKVRALMGWAAVFSPLVVGATVLTGIILLLQDITRWFMGQKSFIHDLIDAIINWARHTKAYQAILKDIRTAWNHILQPIDLAIKKVDELIAKTKSLLHIHRGTSPTPQQMKQLMRSNQALFSPFVTQQLNSISPRTTDPSKSINVTVGGITVNAPNSDATDISKKVSGEIRNQLRKTIYDFDSGIAA